MGQGKDDVAADTGAGEAPGGTADGAQAEPGDGVSPSAAAGPAATTRPAGSDDPGVVVVHLGDDGEGVGLFGTDPDNVAGVEALEGSQAKVEYGEAHTIGITKISVTGSPGGIVAVRVTTRR